MAEGSDLGRWLVAGARFVLGRAQRFHVEQAVKEFGLDREQVKVGLFNLKVELAGFFNREKNRRVNRVWKTFFAGKNRVGKRENKKIVDRIRVGCITHDEPRVVSGGVHPIKVSSENATRFSIGRSRPAM